MNLPEGLEQEFWQELQDYEQEGKMPYITSVERIGYKRGKEEGRKEQSLAIVLRLLPRRVGALPAEMEARVEQLTVAQLEALSEALLDFQSLRDLEAWLEQVRS